MRRDITLRAVGLLAVLGLALAGCGPVDAEPTREDTPRTSTAALRNEEQGRACASRLDCPPNGKFFCTTETGTCNPPPGCDPLREPCPAICFGTCEKGEACNENICTPGTYCCNPLLSLCVPEGNLCIQQ
jgi:hypothetical protein